MSLLLDALKEAEYRGGGANGADDKARLGLPDEPDANGSSPLSLQEDMPIAPRPVASSAAAPSAKVAEVTQLRPSRKAALGATGAKRQHWLIASLCVVALLLGGAYFYLGRSSDSSPVLSTADLPVVAVVPTASTQPAAAVAPAVSAQVQQVLPPWARETFDPALGGQPAHRDSAPRETSALPASTLSVKPIVIVASSTASPLQAGYVALQAGDLLHAQQLYEQVLAAEPGQPDAHLGLGVIAQSQQDRDAAIGHFRAVLVAVPDQPRAWAGLAELSGEGELAALESKLRGLLVGKPEGALYFALGNNLLRQSRWAEAQEQFFAAATAAPENAEYCFNLAVALDRIGKRDAAAAHYRKALQLAEGRSVQFDTASARSRLAAISPGLL
jgi:tetratricopeptide (TPR) repeat protein